MVLFLHYFHVDVHSDILSWNLGKLMICHLQMLLCFLEFMDIVLSKRPVFCRVLSWFVPFAFCLTYHVQPVTISAA